MSLKSANGRPRVLFVTRKWPPAVGGMENYCRELTHELGELTELTIRALPGRADGRPPSTLTLLKFGIATALYLIGNARRFDVVHFGDMAIWALALLAMLLSPRPRLVISAHGTDVAFPLRPGALPKLYDLYLKLGAKLVPRLTVIANSNATAALCRRAGYRNVSVVPLGVRAAPAPSPVAQPEPYILFVGRLVERKGCGWFIRHVLPALPDDITLKVAGTVWDKSEAEALQMPRVEFLGPVYGDALRDLRRRSLAVIMPNVRLRGLDFEGFGLTALEAAADGSVLLASKLDGVVDAVVDGETGFLLPEGNARAWSEKILNLMNWSPHHRRAFVLRAYNTVCEQYSWMRVAKATLEVGLSSCNAQREPSLAKSRK